jgi:protein SCO1
MRPEPFLRLSVVFLLVLMNFVWQMSAEPAAAHDLRTPPAAYHGGAVDPPLPKPKLTLTDTSGAAYDLWSQTNGYVTLLFFGYTHCAGICPMQISSLAGALKKLPKDVADRFKVVFVTTDPERDDPHALRAWLDNFDKDFIGLTGSHDQIQAAQTQADIPPSQGAPEYGHWPFVLAYTKDNLAHVIYPTGISQEDLSRDLAQLAKETWTNR